jgi:hypothetical protein
MANPQTSRLSEVFHSHTTRNPPKRNHSFEEPEDLLQCTQQAVIGFRAEPTESSLVLYNPLLSAKLRKFCKNVSPLKFPQLLSVTHDG